MSTSQNRDRGSADVEINLLDVWRILRASQYWIVGITVGFALLAVVFALTATPRFRALSLHIDTIPTLQAEAGTP